MFASRYTRRASTAINSGVQNPPNVRRCQHYHTTFDLSHPVPVHHVPGCWAAKRREVSG